MSNTVSETALINWNVLSNLYLLSDDGGQYQRIVIINSIYHVKYSVRNSLDQLERIQHLLSDDGGSISKTWHNKQHLSCQIQCQKQP